MSLGHCLGLGHFTLDLQALALDFVDLIVMIKCLFKGEGALHP